MTDLTFCPYCGFHMKQLAERCPSCGKPLTGQGRTMMGLTAAKIMEEAKNRQEDGAPPAAEPAPSPSPAPAAAPAAAPAPAAQPAPDPATMGRATRAKPLEAPAPAPKPARRPPAATPASAGRVDPEFERIAATVGRGRAKFAFAVLGGMAAVGVVVFVLYEMMFAEPDFVVSHAIKDLPGEADKGHRGAGYEVTFTVGGAQEPSLVRFNNLDRTVKGGKATFKVLWKDLVVGAKIVPATVRGKNASTSYEKLELLRPFMVYLVDGRQDPDGVFRPEAVDPVLKDQAVVLALELAPGLSVTVDGKAVVPEVKASGGAAKVASCRIKVSVADLFARADESESGTATKKVSYEIAGGPQPFKGSVKIEVPVPITEITKVRPDPGPVEGETAEVEIEAEDGALVSVNGKEAKRKRGEPFRSTVALAAGENKIEIVADAPKKAPRKVTLILIRKELEGDGGGKGGKRGR